jgi:membrane-associated phospholipid phosphatase
MPVPVVYQLDPSIDVPVIVGTATTWTVLQFVNNEGPPPGPAPDSINPLDSLALNRWEPAIGRASDITLYTVGAAGLATTTVIGRHGHGGWAAPIVLLEGWSVTGFTVEILKQATGRTRPFVSYDTPTADILEAQAEHDAAMSFPSGHTASVGVVSFTTARMLTDAHMVSPVVAFAGATIVTASMGTMRVLAGMHYPTDVIVGGTIGACYGMMIPALHRGPVQVVAGPGGVAILSPW